MVVDWCWSTLGEGGGEVLSVSSRVSLKLELGKILSMDDASGLDKLFLRIVRKFGKQLLGQRVRRACAMALDGAERPRRRALTSAMIQVRQLPSTHTS